MQNVGSVLCMIGIGVEKCVFIANWSLKDSILRKILKFVISTDLMIWNFCIGTFSPEYGFSESLRSAFQGAGSDFKFCGSRSIFVVGLGSNVSQD